MRLTDIAFLNLRRRKGKAAFVVAGLLIGVATVVALFSLVEALTHDVNHKLEKYGANILIMPKTHALSLTYGGMALGGVSFEVEELHQADLDLIKTIPNAGNVAAVGPMALGVVEVGEKSVLLAGIDLKASKLLKPWWRPNGRAPEAGELLAGSEAARILGLEPGGTLSLGERTLPVSGVLEATGSQDDNLLFTDLATAQAIHGKEGRISLVEVAALCKDCPIDDMVGQISRVIPGASVMAIQQVVKGRMEAIAQLKRISYGVCAVVLLVGGLVVLVTMMGSVRERTSEIGIFRALGFRRSHVVRIVLSEAAAVSAFSGIAGYPLGLLATKAALPFFTDAHDVALHFDPKFAALSVVLAVTLGLLASAYPSLAAARLDPNEALRAL